MILANFFIFSIFFLQTLYVMIDTILIFLSLKRDERDQPVSTISVEVPQQYLWWWWRGLILPHLCVRAETVQRVPLWGPEQWLTVLVINDDRVWSCSSIRRLLGPAHRHRWQIGQRGRGRLQSFSPSFCLLNKTLTTTPWLPPLCLTSGHNTELSASNSDRSVKATQMAWTHPSSGPVTQSLLYFST